MSTSSITLAPGTSVVVIVTVWNAGNSENILSWCVYSGCVADGEGSVGTVGAGTNVSRCVGDETGRGYGNGDQEEAKNLRKREKLLKGANCKGTVSNSDCNTHQFEHIATLLWYS